MSGADTQEIPLLAPVVFPPDVASVREARAVVRAVLEEIGAEDLDTAELLVGEVVTNAVLHARTPFEIRAFVVGPKDDRRLRVEVADGSSRLPVMRHPGPDSVTGRGLYLVSVFAAARGVDGGAVEGEGKTVWFEVRLTSPAD